MEKKEYKSFYKESVEENCKYATRLDTYGCGCSHDCKYCYAKSLLNFRGLWNPENPAIADIEKIKKKLNKVPRGAVIRLGGMTDCFQPIEVKEKVTYNTIKELNKRGIHYLIITKSDLIATEEYMEVLDKDLAHIQITLTTTDDNLALEYEKAVVPSRRIKAIEKLQENGFDVAIRLSPYTPELVDVNKINSIKCDKMLVEFLRINHWIINWFGKYINENDYSVKFHGYRHLPFEKKLDLVKQFTIKETTVCDFEPEHLNFWKKEYNPNKEDCCNLRIGGDK